MRRRYTLARLWIAVWSFASILSSTAAELSVPWRLSEQYANGDVFMNVRLLGAVRIDETEVDGYAARELSGLAWDEDEGLLYSVSDDGFLVHLRPRIEGGMLVGVDYAAAYPLREADHQAVTGDWSDSESLAIRNDRNGAHGDSELLVSFELHPRLIWYRPDGERLSEEMLPDGLAHIENYAGKNSGLEAITLHPAFGILVAPERPLKDEPEDHIPIVALDGQRWPYPPLDPEHSALAGMDTLPDGRLLLLERLYASIFQPIYFSVRRLKIGPAGTVLGIDDIVSFSRSRWRIDNFEGIAYQDHERFFLVSDDNKSALQRTLLIYCEIVRAGVPD